MKTKGLLCLNGSLIDSDRYREKTKTDKVSTPGKHHLKPRTRNPGGAFVTAKDTNKYNSPYMFLKFNKCKRYFFHPEKSLTLFSFTSPVLISVTSRKFFGFVFFYVDATFVTK